MSEKNDSWAAHWASINKGVKHIAKNTQRKAEELKDTTEKAFTSWTTTTKEALENRTALLGADDLNEFQASENSLIRSVEHRAPPHIRAAFAYFVAASGVFKNSDDVMRFTRALMDDDKAFLQTSLRSIFDPEEARKISLWMDTAPNTELPGGWAHRLHHGHDLDAMLQLTGEYGVTGAIEWANHVWARDFWTPHGVPYLPTGSGSVYDWLVSQGVSPSTALSLLSINAAELATGLLVFYIGRRLYRHVQLHGDNRKYDLAFQRIIDSIDAGNEPSALELIDDLETASGVRQLSLRRLDLALLCLNQARRANDPIPWSARAFAIASELCKNAVDLPREVDYLGGTVVSFQGLAASIMASSLAAQISVGNYEVRLIKSRLEFGLNRLLELAHDQSKPRAIAIRGKVLAGYRPLSALTNLDLALKLCVAYRPLLSGAGDPIAIRRRMQRVLNQLERDGGIAAMVAGTVRSTIEREYPISPE